MYLAEFKNGLDANAPLAKQGLILVEGTHKDNKGKVHTFNRKFILDVVEKTNALFSKGKRVPVFTDHNKTQANTIGDLDSMLEARVIKPDDVIAEQYKHLIGKLGIFAKDIKIKARQFKEQVEDGIANTLSPGIDTANRTLNEISLTSRPAIIGLSLFSAFQGDSEFEGEYEEEKPYKSEKVYTWEQLERNETDLEEFKGDLKKLHQDFMKIICSIYETPEEMLEQKQMSATTLANEALDKYVQRLEEVLALNEEGPVNTVEDLEQQQDGSYQIVPGTTTPPGGYDYAATGGYPMNPGTRRQKPAQPSARPGGITNYSMYDVAVDFLTPDELQEFSGQKKNVEFNVQDYFKKQYRNVKTGLKRKFTKGGKVRKVKWGKVGRYGLAGLGALKAGQMAVGGARRAFIGPRRPVAPGYFSEEITEAEFNKKKDIRLVRRPDGTTVAMNVDKSTASKPGKARGTKVSRAERLIGQEPVDETLRMTRRKGGLRSYIPQNSLKQVGSGTAAAGVGAAKKSIITGQLPGVTPVKPSQMAPRRQRLKAATEAQKQQGKIGAAKARLQRQQAAAATRNVPSADKFTPVNPKPPSGLPKEVMGPPREVMGPPKPPMGPPKPKFGDRWKTRAKKIYTQGGKLRTGRIARHAGAAALGLGALELGRRKLFGKKKETPKKRGINLPGLSLSFSEEKKEAEFNMDTNIKSLLAKINEKRKQAKKLAVNEAKNINRRIRKMRKPKTEFSANSESEFGLADKYKAAKKAWKGLGTVGKVGVGAGAVAVPTTVAALLGHRAGKKDRRKGVTASVHLKGLGPLGLYKGWRATKRIQKSLDKHIN